LHDRIADPERPLFAPHHNHLIIHVFVAPSNIPIPANLGNPATPPHEHPHPIIPDLTNSNSEPAHPKILGRGLERDYLSISEPLPPWQTQEEEEDAKRNGAGGGIEIGAGRESEEERERRRKRDMLVAMGFPPRPVPGSVIDLDKVLERCDFQTGKVSRGRLEILNPESYTGLTSGGTWCE
jgi:WD repeat and SOF domain-containing protein 1